MAIFVQPQLYKHCRLIWDRLVHFALRSKESIPWDDEYKENVATIYMNVAEFWRFCQPMFVGQ